VGRLIDYASYYVSMWRCARSLAGPGDVLIAKTDPPLTSIFAMRVAATNKARLVNWLQDIYPETAAKFGMPFMTGPIGKSIRRIRDSSLIKADANIVVGELMARTVEMSGVSRERVHVIPNWADDERLRPISMYDNPLRREWELQNTFVVGYSGNLGRAHEIETMLSAADLLRNNTEITFLFIGGGYLFDRLVDEAKIRGLAHKFRFFPYQPRDRLQYSLSVPDVHLVSLRPELEGLIMPSKFYGIAAVGKPIISISSKKGEIGQLVRQHGCGLVVQPGDSGALTKHLLHLSNSPSDVSAMGESARAMVERDFPRKHALARWTSLLASLS
jgi:glycosyltransferase involved in cell wall biosynthesis